MYNTQNKLAEKLNEKFVQKFKVLISKNWPEIFLSPKFISVYSGHSFKLNFNNKY